MPPYHLGPPLEMLITELVYFTLVCGFSLYIFYKTKELYDLSRHKGIYHFRNIFLYFALAYASRLVFVLYNLSTEGFPSRIMPLLNLLGLSYFSTLAILSILVSINFKKIKIEPLTLNLLMHLAALTITVLVLVSRWPFTLTIIHSIIILVSLITLLCHISPNKLTFVLLSAFWMINTLAFTKRLFPREIKIPLYIISVLVFFSIFYRVRSVHAKKKRQA